jgi:multisubunit Na+/H+ antiporter MnhE subunit
MKKLEWIASFIAWLEIVASPLIFGLIIGFIVHLKFPTLIGLIAGISIATLGLIIGIILATRIWKKRGTVEFMSRISATPELDNLEDEK